MFRLTKLLLTIGVGAGFILMVGLTVGRYFTSLDLVATEWLQRLIPRGLDLPFSLFSLLGSTEIVGFILLGIAALVYFKFNKFFWGLGLMALIYVVELLGKWFIYHPGPPREFFRYAFPFSFPQYVSTNYSFPSGHVSRTFFIVVIVIFLIKKFDLSPMNQKILNLLVLILAFVMVVSRVYLGEHWLSDTIGGLFLGTSVGLFATFLF